MRFLGIDYGEKRVGIALTDESCHFAFPHIILKNDKDLIKNILGICSKNQVSKIILGESLNFKGGRNLIMDKIDLFKNNLEKLSGLPVIFEKEYFSTKEAERIQGEDKKRDDSAAALILKSYIDRNS